MRLSFLISFSPPEASPRGPIRSTGPVTILAEPWSRVQFMNSVRRKYRRRNKWFTDDVWSVFEL